jgi:hypothetical protein
MALLCSCYPRITQFFEELGKKQHTAASGAALVFSCSRVLDLRDVFYE